MKRLTIAILFIILFFAIPAYADIDTVEGAAMTDATTFEGLATPGKIEGQTVTAATPSSYCVTCTNPESIICEDFEGSEDPDGEYLCTGWSETVSAGNTIARGSHGGTFSACPNTKGSYSLYTTMVDANGEDAYILKELAATTTAYITLYFRAVETNLGDGDDVTLISLREETGSGASLLYVRLEHDDGGGYFDLDGFFYNSSEVLEIRTSFGNNLAYGDWHKLEIIYIASSQARFQVDGGGWATEDGDGVYSYSFKGVFIGSWDVRTAATAGQLVTEFDIIGFDGSALMGACE